MCQVEMKVRLGALNKYKFKYNIAVLSGRISSDIND